MRRNDDTSSDESSSDSESEPIQNKRKKIKSKSNDKAQMTWVEAAEIVCIHVLLYYTLECLFCLGVTNFRHPI